MSGVWVCDDVVQVVVVGFVIDSVDLLTQRRGLKSKIRSCEVAIGDVAATKNVPTYNLLANFRVSGTESRRKMAQT